MNEVQKKKKMMLMNILCVMIMMMGARITMGPQIKTIHVLLTLTCTLQECMPVDMTMMETTQMVTT